MLFVVQFQPAFEIAQTCQSIVTEDVVPDLISGSASKLNLCQSWLVRMVIDIYSCNETVDVGANFWVHSLRFVKRVVSLDNALPIRHF